MSSGQQQQRFAAAAAAAASLVRTLNNPYNIPAYPQPVSSQGYTYSSTYNLPPVASSSTSRNVHPPRRAPPAHWYSSGSSRCTYPGCAFTGSPKSVEIHMMDRHLIYPPGWHARQRQSDWDADPSLKGRPVPILGTNITLDTEEAVEAWIAERRRRWPTAARVAEKKRKIEEAIASGGLLPEHLMKRPRLPFNVEPTRMGRGRGGGRGGRGRGRGRGHGRGSGLRGAQPPPAIPLTPRTEPRQGTPDSASASDADTDSDAPEVLSAKRPPGIEAYESSSSDVEHEKLQNDDVPVPSRTEPCPGSAAGAETPTVSRPSARPADVTRRAPPPQPKKPPQNPFAPRTSLLRSLLLPEIRMTVSNLSQAIHFLVDNDFLENVELVPGQANEKRIEVVSEQPARPEEGSSVIDDT